MRFIPAFLSALLLTAHFLRWGSFLGLLTCVTVPLLALLVQRRWTLRLLQGFLVLGSLIWIWVAFRIAGERAALEAPYLRMAVILGAVAAFTAWSAWFLQGTELLRSKQGVTAFLFLALALPGNAWSQLVSSPRALPIAPLAPMILSPTLGTMSPLQTPLTGLQTLSASPLPLASPLVAPAAVSGIPRVGPTARVTRRRTFVPAERYQPEKLFELFGKVEAAAARGETPVVIFDLDDTLVSACHRHLRILREFAALDWVRTGYPEFVRRAGQAGLGDMRYRFTDTLRELGISDPRALKSAYGFWRHRFFSDGYIAEDRPIAGADAYVRELARRGATVVYLTARIESRRGATAANLSAHGFPAPDGRRVVLMLKPDHYGGGTGDYKREALEAVARLGNVLGGFDNEVLNVNIFKRRFPGADIFMLDTRRPAATEEPLPGLLWVRDYLSPADQP